MKIVIFFILIISKFSQAATQVRRISVDEDQIIPIQTAVGIATIIQLPERPSSVVIGDLDSFKVEYLDKAITVKPLHEKAKSNLYLYTDWKRYNVMLSTGLQSAADYVVYLKPRVNEQKLQNDLTTWTSFRAKITSFPFSLETNRIGLANEGVILVEFSIRSQRSEVFNPDWIWISQNGRVRPINQLFLSQTKADLKNPIQGVIQLLSKDLDSSLPLKLEIRRKQTSFQKIPKEVLWR